MLPARIERLRNIILDFDRISTYIPRETITYVPDPAKPAIIRKAEACERVFDGVQVNHLRGERFAGNNAVKFAVRPDHLTAEDWQAIKDYPKRVPPETLAAMEARIFYLWSFVEGHIVPDKATVLRIGMNGVIAEIEARLADPALTQPQRDFLTASLIEARAALRYVARHAAHFAALSAEATTAEMRRYYGELARLAAKVPAQPAETFKEALQSFLFTQFATQVDDVTNHSLGRVDQYLYPYYAADIERGALTRAAARELLLEFWLKLNLNYKIQERFGVDYSGHDVDFDNFDPRDGRSWLGLKAIDQIHFDDGQAMDLAGLDENGHDAVNALSWLILEVQDELRTFEPKTNVKHTAKTDPAFMKRAYAMLASGFGMPSIAFHEAGARGLRSYNGLFAERDILDHSHIGCVEIGIPFKSYTDPMNAFTNLAKIVLVTLGNGAVDGKLVGLALGEPETWEALWANFRMQLDYFVRLYTEAMNACAPFYAGYLSRPLTSALIDGCIESATPVDQGGARYWTRAMNSTGFATAVDSLFALKQLVFEEGLLTLDEFRQILARDYEGDESFRLYVKNRVPKFGNGVAEVDVLAWEVMDAYSATVRSYHTPNGNSYRPGIYSFYQPVISMGAVTGATPDGRHAGTLLSVNGAPAHGNIRNGLSGALRSAGALEHSKADNASTVDVQLDGSVPPEVIGYIVDALAKKDVIYAQFTVVDRDRLVDAMAHPEKYQDLVVRVTGFSARFVSLPKTTQEEIIRRSYWG